MRASWWFGRTVHYRHDEDDPSGKGKAVVQTRLMTAEDLIGLPDEYELYEGVPHQVAAAPDGSAIAANLILLLGPFVQPKRLGLNFVTDASFRLVRNPDTLLLPDVAFVRAERIRTRDDLSYPFEGTPDLAVEVRSPSDRVADLNRKMHRYLAAGTLLGWAIDPLSRSVAVYRPGEEPVVLRGNDTLTAGDLIPDFSVVVADVFTLGGFFPE